MCTCTMLKNFNRVEKGTIMLAVKPKNTYLCKRNPVARPNQSALLHTIKQKEAQQDY